MRYTSPMNTLVEAVGWVGAGLVVTAYALSSFGVLAMDGVPYQLMNVAGSMGIIAVSWRKRAYQPAALNVIWLLIAATALLRAA